MAKTSARINVEFRSTGKKENGKPTGYKRTKTTNPRNNTEKLVLNMYDPHAFNEKTGRPGMVVPFKEGKISK